MRLTALKHPINSLYPVVPGSTVYWRPWIGNSRIFALGEGYWSALQSHLDGVRWRGLRL